MASPRQGAERTWRFKLDDTIVLEVATPPPGARRSRRSKLILGALVVALTMAVAFAAGAAAEGTPSIGSDKADYATGEAVALTGSGWAAGETVHVSVDDDQSDAWSYESDVAAADDTTVSDALTLPEVAGTYTVTATAPSGTASATFTATAPAPPPPPPPPASEPSIASDKADYAPGEAVALSGSGWAAGETVHVAVDDDQSDSWSHEADVTAADDGTLSDSFDLTELAGAFAVSATAPSGSADTSFTVTAEPPAPTADPTLTSDKDAYSPGETVSLSGADWTAGGTVHVAVDDDKNDAWEHSADVTVAAGGTITETVDLPDGLAAEFTATATDPADRSATATFSAAFGSATDPYLVRFASGTSTETQGQILAAAGAVDTNYIAPLRIHGVLLPGGAGLQTSLDKLRSYPSVTRVEPDRTREAGGTPNDSNYGDQWSLTKIGWENVFGTVSPSGSAKVAILDTGIDGSHPDLDGNVVSGTSILDGSNGLSDPNGHGTAMAGIIAAETDNGAGVAGVGFAGVTVMPVTVLGADGTGQDSDIIEGVVYAAEHNADVILMAFSNPGYSEMLQAAIDYAWENGAVLVAATGNDGSSSAQFPAGDRGVIGVSNTDQGDALNGSSNYGQDVFLGAPGTGITTTSAGGGYTSITGTSAAAAEVAGAAALIKASSGASNGVIVSRLAKNAEPAGTQEQTGNGRLNVDRAIADESTDTTQPSGAAPVGSGGPFVGPYVASDSVTLTVGLLGTGTGTVTGTGFNCSNVPPGSSNCSNNYGGSTNVTLTAAAGSGSTFAGWGGNCNSSGQVTMHPNTGGGGHSNTNKSCTATFNLTNTAPNSPSGLAQFKSDGASSIPVGGFTNETTVVLKGTVSDSDAGNTVKIEVEVKPVGTSFNGTGLVSGSLVSSGSTASATVMGLSNGVGYHWRGRSVDNSSATSGWVSFGGNAETAADFTVDTTPPTVTCLGDITEEATGPSGAVVSWGAGQCTASDTVDAAVTDCTEVPASGSTFALGTTLVTCSATDASGNSGSDSFDVIVEDTTPPVVDCGADITAEATGPGGATVGWGSDAAKCTATDAVGVTSGPTCTPASGSLFPIGTTPVSCEASDAAGNSGSDSFDVIVQDTTPPVVDCGADITAEATGPGGATVGWGSDAAKCTATDAVGVTSGPTCTPASGSLFPIGTTPVSCEASDAAGNSGSDSFDVIVQDTTPPVVDCGADITAEATGPGGATVGWGSDAAKCTATDAVGVTSGPTCTPASGSLFPIGTTPVSCEASDAAGNSGSDSFDVIVQDTTPPVVDCGADITAEATGPGGATVGWGSDAAKCTATDAVGVTSGPTCTPASGSLFPIGTTPVSCEASDAAGNSGSGSFDVIVQDTTPPVVDCGADITAEATGPGGATVGWGSDAAKCTATDAVGVTSGPTCTPASGSLFPIGTTPVNCSASDAAGNNATGSFTVTVVDTTPPTLNLPSNITTAATGISGAVVTYSASASDLVDGPVAVICSPASGSTFAPGTTTVNCSATDAASNSATGSFTVTVKFSVNGFYQPVDMTPTGSPTVWNTVKNGSTVPLKFEVFAGSTELTDTAIVNQPLKATGVTCAGGTADDIELIATGGTSLRYDTSGGQFIYNWQTPKKVGSCYLVTVSMIDGSSLSAYFKLK